MQAYDVMEGFQRESIQSAAYHLRQVDLRHRCCRDLLVELPPRVSHVAGGPRAHRAREVMVRSHLVHALQMNRVPALQHADVFRGVEQILEADRAVVMHCSFHAAVRILQDVAVATPCQITTRAARDRVGEILVAEQVTCRIIAERSSRRKLPHLSQ